MRQCGASRMLSRARKDRGFTLVEVVVAAVLMAAVAAGLLRAFETMNGISAVQQDRVTAANLARQQLEDLHEAVRWDWWGLANFPLSPGTALGAAAAIVVNGTTYTRSYVVNAVFDGGTEAYRRVDVTVRW